MSILNALPLKCNAEENLIIMHRYASATSIATQSTTESGPVGTSTSSGSSGSSSGASSLIIGNPSVLAGFIAATCWALVGGMLLV